MTADDVDVDVDVGVVTWNTRDLTVSALRRFVDTDHGCRVRLLVHDNASTDGTVDALETQIPEADVDEGSMNVGFGAAMNRLVARGRAPFFFALNSDAWPEAGAIGRLLEVARRHPRAGAVAPRIERPDGTLEFSTLPFPSLRVAALTAAGADRWLSHDRASRLLLEGHWRHDEPRWVDWAVGAALLMRRQTLDEVGGFDPRFFMYAEDVDWCWRATRAGWRIRFEPGALVRHVGNASGEQRYGRARTVAYLTNTHRFYRSTHGPVSAGAYRALCLTGSGRLYLAARRRRDRAMASFWADHVRAHLRRSGDGDV